MLYLLTYCELLLLSLVGLAVGGCNITLRIYVCMLLCGYGVLIFGLYLVLLFLVVPFCPTIVGGSIHLHGIVPLLSGSLKYGFLSMHFWICDYLEEPTINWYPWLSWKLLMLLMLHFTLCGTLVWLHGILNLLSSLWKHISYPSYVFSSMGCSEWSFNHIHTLRRFIYYLYWMWLGNVHISWSKFSLIVLYLVPL